MTIALTEPAAGLFAAQGYAMVRGLVTVSRAMLLRQHLERRAAQGTMGQVDEQVPQTPAVYGDGEVDGLMQDLLPLIEQHTGLNLFPTYSYARIYKHGDELPPHRDRSACEISLSLNLGQVPDAPWALHVGDAGFAAMLTPGDVLIYRGCDQTHWREPYAGDKLVQAFMHYVDQNGPHAAEKFDSRPSLGNAYQPEVTGRLRPFSLLPLGRS
jgi:hypothetical protein